MLLPAFDPPGFLNDFDAGQKAAWNHHSAVGAGARRRGDAVMDRSGCDPLVDLDF